MYVKIGGMNAMLKNTRDGPASVQAVAELISKINRRCGPGAVRLLVVPSADRSLIVQRQDWNELHQLESIMIKLDQEISLDQLARLLELEGV